MIFFTSEKHDEHLNNHKSWMKFFASEKNSMGLFCLCGVEASQSEWKWMSAVFAGGIQL